VDLKHPEYEASQADEFLIRDLRRWEPCVEATADVDDVYALAADMGGMGFISVHHAEILHNNILISTHTLGRGAPERRAPLSLHVVGLRLPRVPPDEH